MNPLKSRGIRYRMDVESIGSPSSLLHDTKSLLFYTGVEGEGILVDCIYLNDGECRAQPRQHLGAKMKYYRPSEDEKKQYCMIPDFQRCPRFLAYQDHLKAVFPIFGKKGQ